MIEILTAATKRALALCSVTGYLSAVLHLYNAMRELDPAFTKIGLFEALCELFTHHLFRGSLSMNNFSFNLRRTMGSDVALSGSDLSLGNSKLNPADPARAKPISPNSLSLFCCHHSASFQVETQVTNHVHHGWSSKPRLSNK